MHRIDPARRRAVYLWAQSRGGAVWQLVGLITRRSKVQILPPQPDLEALLRRQAAAARGALRTPRKALRLARPGESFRRSPASSPWPASCRAPERFAGP